VLWACVVALVALFALLATPFLANLLRHAMPPLAGLAVAALAGPAVWMADRIRRRGLVEHRTGVRLAASSQPP
jgi:hypothetical protein